MKSAQAHAHHAVSGGAKAERTASNEKHRIRGRHRAPSCQRTCRRIAGPCCDVVALAPRRYLGPLLAVRDKTVHSRAVCHGVGPSRSDVGARAALRARPLSGQHEVTAASLALARVASSALRRDVAARPAASVGDPAEPPSAVLETDCWARGGGDKARRAGKGCCRTREALKGEPRRRDRN